MTTIMDLECINKRYGRRLAVEDASLSVMAGEILGLVGPNGAGKTTLLRIAAGLIRPTSGVVSPGFAPRPGTVRYFGGERTLPNDVSARSWQSMWGVRNRTPARTERLGQLSRGTRQRIGLEVALSSDEVRLLLLDEPWEGLDPDASRWLSGELARKRRDGVAVVVSSHRIHDLASICDRCEFLVSGHVIPPAVVTDRSAPTTERAGHLFAAFDRARAHQ